MPVKEDEMRSDMHKLLCLRGRYGSRDGDKRRSDSRRVRKKLQLVYGEDEDGKFVESTALSRHKMGRFSSGGGSKEFGEYFAPLEGWLHKQVGRHWDDIYSEFRSVMNKDSAVRIHAFSHFFSWFEMHVEIVGSDVYDVSRDWKLSGGDLYVHPETRLLCKVPRAPAKESKDFALPIRLSGTTFLVKMDGIWYRVVYSREVTVNDFDAKRPLRIQNIGNPKFFSVLSMDATYTKRQLGRKELRLRGLSNGHGTLGEVGA